ncbi:MAG: trimeric intracellular cation channel family protein [Eggerthellaceae bacterium]
MEHRLFLRRRWRVDGALFACDRKLDIIGTVVLGLVTGYGGGIIRDMLLQTHGCTSPRTISSSSASPSARSCSTSRAVPPSRCHGVLRRRAVGGIVRAGRRQQAFSLEQGFVLSVILGAITAVGGGAVRDICVGNARHFPAVELLRGGRPRRIVRVRGLAVTGSPLPLAVWPACSSSCSCAIGACTSTGRPATRPTSPQRGARRGQGAARRVRCVPARRRCHRGAEGASPPRRWRRNHEKRD